MRINKSFGISALSGKDFLTNNLILLELKKTNQPSKYANSGQSRKMEKFINKLILNVISKKLTKKIN